MKSRKLNPLRRVFVLWLITLCVLSCKDNGTDTIEKRSPSIVSVSPDKGIAGEEVTIVGKDFGSAVDEVRVRFNTTSAKIISASETLIKAEAPTGFTDHQVNVSVVVGDKTSNAVAFYYLNTAAPTISSVTSTCFTGSIVRISGNNFSPEPDENIVKFGAINATVVDATKTLLTVIAPNLGSAISTDITVTKYGKTSNPRNITVDVDQNKIATYEWTTHTVKPGVVYKTGQFSLFNSSQRRIHILDVDLESNNVLGIGFDAVNKSTVAMCTSYEAVAGINAGYFPMSGAVDKDPFIRIDGNTVQNGHLGISQVFSNAALTIHNNVAGIRKFSENHTNLNQIAAAIPVAQAQNVIVSGPILIKDGVLEQQNMASSHNTSVTARTGIGVSADGKRVIMVVVDYNQGATGVTTPQLASILQALGAVDAMNFDGGGSSTMFVQNQGNNGRVSINGNSMRAVRSVLYVK